MPPSKEMPNPVVARLGWPWTEEASLQSKTMPDGNPWPKITIVTPSFNQGKFLEETIRSVLNQGYPNLEYIVIDGGSTDESIQIIERYKPWITRVIIEPDHGQVDAIKKGLRFATGEWFNWLNSDDILLPNALITLARIIQLIPESKWVTGTRLVINSESAAVGNDSTWRTSPSVVGLGVPDFPQDATFIKTEWLNRSDVLDKETQVFDTLLYFQLCRIALPTLTPACFSAIRWHNAQKTANTPALAHESKKWIDPELRKLPLFSRAMLFLGRIRGFSQLISLLLRIVTKKRLSRTAQNYKAAVYDPTHAAWKLVPASDVVKF
jgi:glycosyltransferase involved in cell wall biosynthesis